MFNTRLARLISTQTHWFSFHMPYAYVRLPHPRFRHIYLPLNRHYKPLGVVEDNWVDYMDFMGSDALHFASNPTRFRHIWHRIDRSGILYLYADSGPSKDEYFVRLERLLTMPMKMFETHGRDFDMRNYKLRQKRELL